MSYWKCRVDCYYKTRHSQPTPKRRTRWILCDAADYDEARAIATEFGEKTATFGPLLVAIEVVEIASAKLPMELKQ